MGVCGLGHSSASAEADMVYQRERLHQVNDQFGEALTNPNRSSESLDIFYRFTKEPLCY